MAGKEGPDHRRRSHSPDRKAEKDYRVRLNVRNHCPEKRLVTRISLPLHLADHRLVVFGIRLSRLDFEEIRATSPVDLPSDDTGIARAREVGDQRSRV